MLEPHGLRDSLYAYFIEHHFEMLWCHLLWFLYGQSWQTLHYTLYNTLICDMYHSDKSDTLLDKIEKPKKLISFCWGSKNSCPLVKVLEWMFYGLLGNIGQYWKEGNSRAWNGGKIEGANLHSAPEPESVESQRSKKRGLVRTNRGIKSALALTEMTNVLVSDRPFTQFRRSIKNTCLIMLLCRTAVWKVPQAKFKSNFGAFIC